MHTLLHPMASGQKRTFVARNLAHLAVTALIAEAELTPKPALVDQRGSGAHADLTLALMKCSARTLSRTFTAIACASAGQQADQRLRERLGALGREGEKAMLAATNGVNTHRGAIWAVGLLVAGAAIAGTAAPVQRIAASAGELARLTDRFAPESPSHGLTMQSRYGAAGARGEAQNNFPRVMELGLPTLWAARQRGTTEMCARLDALFAIMAYLDDTCLLYRGGQDALNEAREGARAILHAGGMSTVVGRDRFFLLEQALLVLHASPGGSADLLAATLFLDALTSTTPHEEGKSEWKI
jgi:triphosphoribosyl-dephospho-CoA synthase